MHNLHKLKTDYIRSVCTEAKVLQQK